jgi:streptomycin 6-kinase
LTGDQHVEIPDALIASHAKFFGDRGRVWITALPRVAADCLDRWSLRRDGPPLCGAVALVLPVLLADGTAAVLKLQPVDEETAGEPVALDAWNGHGAVRLLRHDAGSGSMLLERLDADRTLAGVHDDLAALTAISDLLVRLNAVAAPPGIRRLSDVAAAMLDRVPHALTIRSDPAERRLLRSCAAAVEEVLPEPGDRLLHWDLHYDNVLARPAGPHPGDRGPSWVAIDPKPLAGDPGFELLAALHNRWDEVVASGDVRRAVRRRYNLMTDVQGLDRRRAACWTLGRVLQNLLWETETDEPNWSAAPDRAIARTLLDEY